jgi:dipeptidase
LSGEKLTDYLTRENQKTVAHTKKDSEELMGQMFTDAIKMSKLTFKMDPNL